MQVHALKSTALSIGGEKLSEMAKALEMAGKENNIAFIKDNHKKAMEVYDKPVGEGWEILSNGSN